MAKEQATVVLSPEQRQAALKRQALVSKIEILEWVQSLRHSFPVNGEERAGFTIERKMPTQIRIQIEKTLDLLRNELAGLGGKPFSGIESHSESDPATGKEAV